MDNNRVVVLKEKYLSSCKIPSNSMDNDRVVVLKEKYLSGCKIPSNIVSKGVVEESAGLEDPGRGKT
jgi:hypothetical protein